MTREGSDGTPAGTRRLERSRLAILQHIVQRERPRERDRGTRDEDPRGDEAAHRSARQDLQSADSTRWSQGTGPLRGWWQSHPGRLAIDMAQPLLASYARRRPVRYLVLAAAGGAAVLLLRPWRLISVTGVLVALVKSPQVLSLAMSALTRGRNPAGDEQPPA